MLPLTKDRALELFGEDVPVHQLHADGLETLVEDREALQGHDGLFGVEKNDWDAYLEYQSMKQELDDSEPNREAQLLYGNEGRFGIYQLKDTEETRDIRFVAMDYLEMKGIPVSKENYELVYTGEMKEKRLIPKNAGRIKVLAGGVMTKALTIEADKYSIQAVKMITLAGGKAEQYR